MAEERNSLSIDVVHDLDNLLTGITAAAELAMKGSPKGQLCLILQAANSARRLLAPPTNPLVDINRTVELVAAGFQNTLPPDIQLELVTAQHNLGPVAGAQHHVERILLNLLINAQDAILGPGHITIKTENKTVDEEGSSALGASIEPGNYVLLAVADSGTGVQASHNVLFQPFFTTKKYGRGLGLYSVEKTVSEMGGHVQIRSRSSGTTFEVYFPTL